LHLRAPCWLSAGAPSPYPPSSPFLLLLDPLGLAALPGVARGLVVPGAHTPLGENPPPTPQDPLKSLPALVCRLKNSDPRCPFWDSTDLGPQPSPTSPPLPSDFAPVVLLSPLSGPLRAHLGCRAAMPCKSLTTPPPLYPSHQTLNPHCKTWYPSPLLLRKSPHKPRASCAGSLGHLEASTPLDSAWSAAEGCAFLPSADHPSSLPLSSTPPHTPFPHLSLLQSVFSATLFSPLPPPLLSLLDKDLRSLFASQSYPRPPTPFPCSQVGLLSLP